MSSAEKIDEFHPVVPILRTPKEKPAAQEEEIFLSVPQVEKATLPLKVRLKKIPRQCLEFFKDEEWMSLIVDFFGIASRSLEFVGNVGGKYIPYLSIASSPFYLYHALKHSKERFQLMWTAAKTSRVADVLFWCGQAIDSTGEALSGITRPFAGGLELGGLTSKHFALGVCFSLVIPVILIVFGAIGGLTKGWAMVRTQKALRRFNREVEKEDGSLKALAETLEYIQRGHLISADPQERLLDEKHFNENHFTNAYRKEAVHKRIQTLLGHHDLHKVRSSMEHIVSKDVENAVHPFLEEMELMQDIEPVPELVAPLELLSDIKFLNKKLVTATVSEFQLADETLGLYERLLNQIDVEHDLYGEIKRNRDELADLKEEILREGGEIIGTVRSEIHRQLCYHAFFILVATITLTAGVLLMYAQYSHIGYGLALAGSSMNIIYIIFEKKVSQETFCKMDRYFQNLLDKNSHMA
ncbi:MAG: hypothetical protein JJU12_01845 [Chlamydiales bacterium]|nr:hypothetical protein [Chlamydiales bacterium]